MLRHPMYLLYGFTVLALTGLAQYQGWTLTSTNEVQNVPRTVRDNPGSYRAIYSGFPHYTGGK